MSASDSLFKIASSSHLDVSFEGIQTSNFGRRALIKITARDAVGEAWILARKLTNRTTLSYSKKTIANAHKGAEAGVNRQRNTVSYIGQQPSRRRRNKYEAATARLAHMERGLTFLNTVKADFG